MKPKKVVGKTFGLVEEKLSQAGPQRPACMECGLHRSCQEPFLPPYVPKDWSGKVLLVMEPSEAGEKQYSRDGVYLSDMERTKLKEVLCQSDLTKKDIAFSPVLRCRPVLTGSKKPKMTSLRACRPFLLRTLSQLKPAHVVALGESAVKACVNTGAPGPMNTLRGRVLPIVPTVGEFVSAGKLSSLVIDPHATTRMIEDLKRLSSPILEHPHVDRLGTGKKVAFDTEYTGAIVHCLGYSDGIAACTTSAHKGLDLSGKTLIGHNIVVDLEALLRVKQYPKQDMEEWLQGKRIRDTQLEARLADENRGKGGYKLESLLCAFFNVKDYKAPTEALGHDSSKWPKLLREDRCRLDAWATFKIHEKLQEQIEGPSRLTHRIALSLRRMYWAGVFVSQRAYDKMHHVIVTEHTLLTKKVQAQAKEYGLVDFSATNDNQVREYVYGEQGVGLKVEKYTKGKLPSVSAKHLKEHESNPAIQTLLQFSKVDKLKSTYCESLIAKCHPVKGGLWLPVQINPLAAKTGRRASSNPNLQNWPISVRRIVVSRFKNGLISDNDYSKLEPILGGWVTNEPKLTDYFVKYPNGYIKIGEDFFKTSVEKNSSQYKMMKSLILAILYKKMKWSLAEDLWINYKVQLDSNYETHTEKAGEILEDFLDMFPGVRRYHQRQEETVLRDGQVVNALGQVRRLPLPPEPPRSEKWANRVYFKYRSHVINQAVNYPIQSLASYVTGCALVDLEAAFLRQWKYSYVDYQTALMQQDWPQMPLLCIEVHDDLVQDIPKGMDKKTKEITHSVMQRPPSLVEVLPELFDSNVKLTVDTNTAPTWGQKA